MVNGSLGGTILGTADTTALAAGTSVSRTAVFLLDAALIGLSTIKLVAAIRKQTNFKSEYRISGIGAPDSATVRSVARIKPFYLIQFEFAHAFRFAGF